jgi:hypothetical protein
MNAKHKMAVAGSGLVAAGIGLGIVGTALIVPAVFTWAAKLLDKGTQSFGSNLEAVSRRAGSVAGTLQRSFTEAARAGVTEIKGGSSKARDIAD